MVCEICDGRCPVEAILKKTGVFPVSVAAGLKIIAKPSQGELASLEHTKTSLAVGHFSACAKASSLLPILRRPQPETEIAPQD